MTQATTPEISPAAGTGPLTRLVTEIEHTQHAWLREILLSLDQLTAGIAVAHGRRDPRLREVRETFLRFDREMNQHLQLEEETLFPVIRRLEAASGQSRTALNQPIREMRAGHELLERLLQQLSGLTDGFRPASWASADHRLMLDQLRMLDEVAREHLHKEAEQLFPAALALGGS